MRPRRQGDKDTSEDGERGVHTFVDWVMVTHTHKYYIISSDHHRRAAAGMML